MKRKPHICQIQSGSGAWGVYGPGKPRLIGRNNTFRTFHEATVYARNIYYLMNPVRQG